MSPLQTFDGVKQFLLACKEVTNDCDEFEHAQDTTFEEKENMLDMQDLLAKSLTKLMNFAKEYSREAKAIHARGIKEEVDRAMFTISCMGQMLRNKMASRTGTKLEEPEFQNPSEMATLKSMIQEHEETTLAFSITDLMVYLFILTL